MNLTDLHNFENNCTVGEILCAYYNTDRNGLINSLEDDVDGMLGYWADLNNIVPSELVYAIDGGMDEIVNANGTTKFSVLNEVGSGGGWPECELTIMGYKLPMDWVIDC